MTNAKFAQSIFWHFVVAVSAYFGFIKGIQIFETTFWVFFWIWVAVQSMAIIILLIFSVIFIGWKDKFEARIKVNPNEFDEARQKIDSAFGFKAILISSLILCQIVWIPMAMESIGKDPSMIYNVSLPLFIIGILLATSFKKLVKNLILNR